MKRCVFFDRDGVVNVSPGPGYVERWEDFHLQQPFVDAARVAQRQGYAIAIVTNQRCVARGIVPREEVERIHANLTRELASHGVELLGVYVCMHDRGQCDCRKPQPGLLLQAASEHDVDMANSWMVGDNETDVEAGHRAGCRAIRVAPLTEKTAAEERVPAMDTLPGLLERVLA